MDQDYRDYCLVRAREETAIAARLPDGPARMIHLKLADHYAAAARGETPPKADS